jgi:hypothetical protein
LVHVCASKVQCHQHDDPIPESVICLMSPSAIAIDLVHFGDVLWRNQSLPRCFATFTSECGVCFPV